MVKEGITRMDPDITPMESTDSTPIITNQPVAVLERADRQNFGDVVLAPAATVNNVAQVRLGDYKKEIIAIGAVIGEGVVSFGCLPGAVFGAAEIATQMGATSAVTTCVATGAGMSAGLCMIGAVCTTVGCYLARLRST
ncbi:MAG: hypothetical protein OXF02_03695 [Simkaniaceae bacterium]|nr:hypothetical protein [Simkaniaceae bacterium]